MGVTCGVKGGENSARGRKCEAKKKKIERTVSQRKQPKNRKWVFFLSWNEPSCYNVCSVCVHKMTCGSTIYVPPVVKKLFYERKMSEICPSHGSQAQ